MKHLYQFTGFVAGIIVVLALVVWQPLAGAAALPLSTPLSDVSSQPAGNHVVSALTAISCDSGRTVHVSGTAAVHVIPDRALIQLGVVSNGRTPDGVQAENAATIKQVVDAILWLGIDEKNISTDRYIVRPVYDDYDSLHIVGYRVDNVVAITLTDVDKTSNVLIAAFKAGANQVLDVQFYTSELRRYRDDARELAMKAAVEKAEALANAAGTEAGCVLSINENTWSYYSGSWGGGHNRDMWTQNVVQNVTGDQSMPDEMPISVGKIAIHAEVNASFSLQ